LYGSDLGIIRRLVMRFRRVGVLLLSVFTLALFVARAPAGIVSYTDIDEFRAAAGPLVEIDFETLPDGNPSFFGARITPEFNYSDLGVEFFSHIPELYINGSPGGFGLRAGPFDTSTGPPNWLIADLVIPATAVGIFFPGDTTIVLFNESNKFMGNWASGESGLSFFGVVANGDPIGSMIVNRGDDFETITSFHFTPIPEPSGAILMLFGVAALIFKRVRMPMIVRGSSQ
jgi:hypothetical protein